MCEPELALGVLAVKRGAPLHGSAAVGAHLHDRDLIEDASATDRVSFQRLDHQPLIRMSSTYIAPAHIARLAAPVWQNNFREKAQRRAGVVWACELRQPHWPDDAVVVGRRRTAGTSRWRSAIGYVSAMTATKPWLRYAGIVASEATETHAQLLWSGGRQAIRLPRRVRLPGSRVVVRRDGKTLVLEPLPGADDWDGFWDRLVPLARPIRRRKARSGPPRRRR